MKRTRRATLVFGSALLAGCVGDDRGDRDDATAGSDDGNGTPPSGSDEPGSLEIRGTIFTDPGLEDSVTAVSAQDGRFEGAELWQRAFDAIATRVREGDERVDDPDRESVLVESNYDSTAAQTAREVFAELPESTPQSYPDGKFVRQMVDGDPTFTRVRILAPTPD